jgi:hypothetical protein
MIELINSEEIAEWIQLMAKEQDSIAEITTISI